MHERRAWSLIWRGAIAMPDSAGRRGWPRTWRRNLGVEAHRVGLLLDDYLRAHLTEMAEVRIELR